MTKNLFSAARFRPLAMLGLVALLAFVVGCQSSTDTGQDTPADSSPFQFGEVQDDPQVDPVPPKPATVQFTRLAMPEEFVYVNGEQGQSLMVETVGGGCGWLDIDRDGHWDLYLCQGGDSTKPADSSQPLDALYRNDGEGNLQLVTDVSGIRDFGYGQGVAVGDFNEDGFDDIYVTNVGSNTFWMNMGDGTFEEITQEANVDDPRWSSSAAFGDIDLDGDLDLYVCNYLVYDPSNPVDCRSKNGESRICHPKDIEPYADECFINQGDGTFTAEARQRGLFGEGNKGLGVAIADFNNDQLPDIYVANDTTANFLFLNQGEGKFAEQASLLGCAANRAGAFQASMGLGVCDFDRNGFLDIYATHFYGESNTMYKNLGAKGFRDVTPDVGLHAPTMSDLGWGIVANDFDFDGYDELFVATGHVENYPGNPLHKMYPNLLTSAGESFQPCAATAGDYFKQKYVGRGAAGGDLDNDGDADLVVVHQNTPTAILRNDSKRGNWLKLEFRGSASNRRGIGCRVFVTRGETKQMQELAGGTSFASSNQPALYFGLGEDSKADRIEILWPSGKRQVLEDVPANQHLTIDEPNA
ncbi:MAG TPA: hypothetical protein DCY79_21035 [Planctomycetaceae bacterium]|nr:hypothetical protein [Blastopirellula sp.]HAY82299.1 hypothetical protein [Planctomycetaceae bacterium]